LISQRDFMSRDFVELSGLHSLHTVCTGCNPCRPHESYVDVGFGKPAYRDLITIPITRVPSVRTPVPIM
jgi:hypothetical protein